MNYLISVDELAQLKETEPVVILDIRAHLTDHEAGREAYEAGHLPGAYHLDMERDLSGKSGEHGGNHPLPDLALLVDKLSELGVSNERTVVVYDKANDMFAARAWWLLHYLGHEKVYLLDGGYQAWVDAAYPVTTEVRNPERASFIPNVKTDLTVSMSEVKKRNQETILIDSRAKERYTGDVEPLYKKAGHIPGAKNYFWQKVLRDNGKWKSAAQLAEHFQGLNEDKEIIVSCGSGVSACPNFIALKMAGFNKVKLYPGSFSDWISYPENVVAKGEE